MLREFDRRSRHLFLVIILLILITFSLDDVWILLGENWCWSPLGLKGLNHLLGDKPSGLSIGQGFWYFAEKKQNFAGFSRANSRKNWPISRDFRWKKVKIRGKIGRSCGRRVKIRRKIGQFCGILAEKSQISKDFQGQILRKIGRFHGKFRGGNYAKKQSIKNSRFRWIFWANFGKIHQFCVDMTSVV